MAALTFAGGVCAHCSGGCGAQRCRWRRVRSRIARDETLEERRAELLESVLSTERRLASLDEQPRALCGDTDSWRTVLRQHLVMLEQGLALLDRAQTRVGDVHTAAATARVRRIEHAEVHARIEEKLDFILDWIARQPPTAGPSEG